MMTSSVYDMFAHTSSLCVAVLCSCCLCLASAAETVELQMNDGRTITGQVVSEDAKFITVEVRDGKMLMQQKVRLSEVSKRSVVEVPEPVAEPQAGADAPAEGTGWHPFLTETIGDRLVDAQGQRLKDLDLAESKYVMLYFSAHWCPPCRAFTPKLVDWYNELGEDRDVEIVFISSDRDRKAMSGYMQEAKMPWPGLLWGSAKTKPIKQRYAGPGIPCLVLLGPDDQVLADSYVDGKYQGPTSVMQQYAKREDLLKAAAEAAEKAEKQ